MQILVNNTITKQSNEPFWEEQFPEKAAVLHNYATNEIQGIVNYTKTIDGNTMNVSMTFADKPSYRKWSRKMRKHELFQERKLHRKQQAVSNIKEANRIRPD